MGHRRIHSVCMYCTRGASRGLCGDLWMYVPREQQRWSENTQRTRRLQSSLRWWSHSRLSSQSKTVKYEPSAPPDRWASYQSIKTEGDSFAHTSWYGERDPVWGAADRLKPNNTDIWYEARLTLPPWSLSSSNRDQNPQNSPVVSLIGEQHGPAFD